MEAPEHMMEFGQSNQMQEVETLAHQIAGSSCEVMITGETGTGKTALAKMIHEGSDRGDQPFVRIDCSTIAESLMEGEIFGYEKGAYTGAQESKEGLMDLASGGTVFFDELASMDHRTQAKLLDVVQFHTFRRVGGRETVPVDVRIIASAQKEPEADDIAEAVRADLYFRLQVIEIQLPPLREHPEDVPALAYCFLERYREIKADPVVDISPEAISALQAYEWPGNVRELENVIKRAIILARSSRVTRDDLPSHIRPCVPALPTLQQAEDDYILRALNANGWSIAKVADLIGVHVNTLSRKVGRLRKQALCSSPSFRRLQDVKNDHVRQVFLQCGRDEEIAAVQLGIAKKTLVKKLRELGPRS